MGNMEAKNDGLFHNLLGTRNRVILESTMLFTLLAACGRATPTENPTLTSIPPGVTETIRPTDIPTVEPTTGFATETLAPYTEPSLVEMKVVPNSGGAGHAEVLGSGVSEQKLKAYEDAAYTWAAASGFNENNPLTLEEITNGLSGEKFRWAMILRTLVGNNILWAQSQDGKTYNTFPTTIKVDTSGIHGDPAWKAVELPDTQDAAVIFMSDVYPVAVRNPVTGTDGNTYYSEWFDTLTGEWIKDKAVEAIPKAEYYIGLAGSLDRFTQTSKERKQAFIQDVFDHQTLSEPQPDKNVGIVPFSYGAWSGILLECRMGSSCAWRTSVVTIDPTSGLPEWDVVLEVRLPGDDHSHVVDLCIDEDSNKNLLKTDTTYKLNDLLRYSIKGRLISLFIVTKRINSHNYSNPVVREMIDGVTPERRRELDNLQKTLKILDSLSKEPLWLWRSGQPGELPK